MQELYWQQMCYIIENFIIHCQTQCFIILIILQNALLFEYFLHILKYIYTYCIF